MKEDLDHLSNYPCQYQREGIENDMENMHTAIRV